MAATPSNDPWTVARYPRRPHAAPGATDALRRTSRTHSVAIASRSRRAPARPLTTWCFRISSSVAHLLAPCRCRAAQRRRGPSCEPVALGCGAPPRRDRDAFVTRAAPCRRSPSAVTHRRVVAVATPIDTIARSRVPTAHDRSARSTFGTLPGSGRAAGAQELFMAGPPFTVRASTDVSPRRTGSVPKRCATRGRARHVARCAPGRPRPRGIGQGARDVPRRSGAAWAPPGAAVGAPARSKRRRGRLALPVSPRTRPASPTARSRAHRAACGPPSR